MVDRFFLATKAFVVNQGEVLVVRESGEYGDGTNVGRFDVPGGRLEPGEHFEESLKREVEEETGLKVEVGNPFHVDEWRPDVDGEKWQIVGVFFECEADSRDVEPGEDHDDYRWIEPENHEDHRLIDDLHGRFKAFLER
ncbi:MAG: NUDIX domain-containing protein [Candidatus Nanohaloarchaea archaeon]